LLLAISFGSASFAHAEQGDESALSQIRAQHAISSLFGLPAVAARPVQTREWQVSIEHSNQYMGGTTGEDALLLDGESSELVLRHRQRVGACVQLEASIPVIQHSGGSFDEAIDRWHRVFGLPDANRADAPFNALFYGFSDATGERFSVDSMHSGIGDVQVSLQRSMGCYATADSTRFESIVRMGLKLPTGSPSKLTGSGALDAFADIQSPVWAPANKWRTGVSIGAMVLGDSDLLPRQRNLALFGSLGSQYALFPRFRLLTQLDWHTPFYESGLRELGGLAISFSAGFRILGPADQTIEFTISEDAAIDTTPDIVARLAWTYRPSGGR